MHIDDSVHTLVCAVFSNFLYALEVILADSVGRRICALVESNGDSNAVESVLVDLRDHFLSCSNVAPHCFILAARAVSVFVVCAPRIKSIAEVPAKTHIVDDLDSGHVVSSVNSGDTAEG